MSTSMAGLEAVRLLRASESAVSVRGSSSTSSPPYGWCDPQRTARQSPLGPAGHPLMVSPHRSTALARWWSTASRSSGWQTLRASRPARRARCAWTSVAGPCSSRRCLRCPARSDLSVRQHLSDHGLRRGRAARRGGSGRVMCIRWRVAFTGFVRREHRPASGDRSAIRPPALKPLQR